MLITFIRSVDATSVRVPSSSFGPCIDQACTRVEDSERQDDVVVDTIEHDWP